MIELVTNPMSGLEAEQQRWTAFFDGVLKAPRKLRDSGEEVTERGSFKFAAPFYLRVTRADEKPFIATAVRNNSDGSRLAKPNETESEFLDITAIDYTIVGKPVLRAALMLKAIKSKDVAPGFRDLYLSVFHRAVGAYYDITREYNFELHKAGIPVSAMVADEPRLPSLELVA